MENLTLPTINQDDYQRAQNNSFQSNNSEPKKFKNWRDTSLDLSNSSKSPEGQYEFWILPPFGEKNKIDLAVYTHWRLPAVNGGNAYPQLDVEKTFPELGIANPINKVLAKYKNNPSLKDLLTAFESKCSAHINVLVKETPHFPQGIRDENGLYIPYVLQTTPAASTFIWDYITKKSKDIEEDFPNAIWDPYKGYSLLITKTIGAKTNANSKISKTSYERKFRPAKLWYPELNNDPQAHLEAIKKTLAETIDLYKELVPNDYYLNKIQETADYLDEYLAMKLEHNKLKLQEPKPAVALPEEPAIGGKELPGFELQAPQQNVDTVPLPDELPF